MAEPETHPFSPAGEVERYGALSRGLAGRRWGKAVVWVLLAFIVLLPTAVVLLGAFVHHH